MNSIEWLAKQLLNAEPNVLEWQKYILQAKEMHKQEIIDAYVYGEFHQGFENEAEQYYQETFVSKVGNTLENYHIVDTKKMVEFPKQEISDEEIKKNALFSDRPFVTKAWIEGAQWYREQLKQK